MGKFLVILVDSNAEELALLKTKEYQTKSALAIYRGILEYYVKQEK